MICVKLSDLLFSVILTDLTNNIVNYAGVYAFVQSKQADHPWNEALNVMSFHRNKMNEYLCKYYVASEIVETYKNHSGKAGDQGKGKFKNSRLARESLLADPGSQKYKDWLSRSSTLEDIYRQLEHSENDHHESHQEALDGHEGEVTGYALLGHKYAHSKPTEYGEDYHSHGYYKDHHKEDEDDEHHEKGLKLKELFHFALTAIAFLAFACFMIEVIMCLMEVPQQTTAPDYVLVPTTTGGTGHSSKLDPSTPEEAHRQERTLNLDPISLETLNIISGKVLSSIEALTILHEDDGQCLRRALCQNSKYSKSLRGTQKIWLPIWSFGISWIGERLSKKSLKKKSSTLEYLKAAVMGLGNSECHVLYPECDNRRRRRRRKVSH